MRDVVTDTLHHGTTKNWKVLPQGVTEANYRAFMGACACLADLADMSVQQLTPLAGSVLFAKKLHDFLHAPCPVADAWPREGSRTC